MKTKLRPIATAALSLGVLFQVGCAWGFGGEDVGTTEMHRQLSNSVSIQTGIVLGDLDRIQDAAEWLATHEERIPLPGTVDAQRADLRGYAATIAQTTDLAEIADRTGHMAAACGSCHQTLSVGPRFRIHSGPPSGTGSGALMVRTLWAADRMWEGLVGPSEEAWNAGVHALGDLLAHTDDTSSSSQIAALQLGYGSRVSKVVQDARMADTQEERGAVYSRLLTTCNSCHTRAGIMVER